MSLSASEIEAVELELFKQDIAISAAEDWADQYNKDPKTHAALLKAEAAMLRTCRRFFRNMADDIDLFISWSYYRRAVELKKLRDVQADENDISVDVIVRDDQISKTDGTFLTVIFDDIATAAAVGAQSGENIYKRYLGLERTDAVIQRYAREQAAGLVGKKLDKDGNTVDNPAAKYRISDKTRADIRSSIQTSISLGEDQTAATDRLKTVIRNPKRAALIAQTEAVNSFQGGLLTFGRQSGAVGKQSQAVGAIDNCATYDKAGIVAINYKYDGLFDGPAYHPRCRCGLRLVFPEELESL